MDPVGIGFTPEPPENGMSPKLGHYDLNNTCKAELGHNDLIRDILHMWWNLKVQPTPKLFFGDGPTSLCPD